MRQIIPGRNDRVHLTRVKMTYIHYNIMYLKKINKNIFNLTFHLHIQPFITIMITIIIVYYYYVQDIIWTDVYRDFKRKYQIKPTMKSQNIIKGQF